MSGTDTPKTAVKLGDRIKPGATVQLKSGGPVMTVERIDKGELRCSWHDANHELQSRNFLPEMLNLILVVHH